MAIAVVFEQDGATIDPSTFTLGVGGDTQLAILSTNDPVVTLVSTSSLDIFDGTLQCGSGPSITFTDFGVLDGTLTIDAKARTLTPAGDGPPVGTYAFSADSEWLALAPGANAMTNSTGGSIVVTHRDTFT